MINSIPKIESKYIDAFGNVTGKQIEPNAYWLPAQNSSPTKSDNNKEKDIKTSLPKIQILTPEEARKTNNATLIGLSIAGSTILVAAGIFFILKGGPKGISKGFQNFKNYLEEKVQRAKLNNMSDTPLNRAYIFMIRKLDIARQRSEAINNFVAIKDASFKKLMYCTDFTRGLHKKITNIFEKWGLQAVKSTYNSTLGAMNNARDMAAGISMKSFSRNTGEIVEINGVKKTKLQWLDHALHMDDDLSKIYETHFGTEIRNSRYFRIRKSAKELEETFKDLKAFWSEDLVKSFMVEDVILKEKLDIQKLVHSHRKEFSYSLSDLGRDSEDLIIKMTKAINYKDINKINMLRTLRQNVIQYSKGETVNPELQAKIIKGADAFRSEIMKAVKNKTMSKDVSDQLLDNLTKFRNLMNNFKQGKVEDILEIYKKILPPSEYSTVEKFYRESVNSLDKSIQIETEDFINKVRDLALGSAPTDILSVLGGIATLGYYLGKSDNKEERTSISLKYGIPALAGIGVSIYSNAKLFAGTKSLLFGGISTWIFNRLGSYADNKLKEHRIAQNPAKSTETEKQKKIA